MIRDEAVKRALKLRARRIHRRALLIAVASTMLVLIVPDRLDSIRFPGFPK